jgi:transposase
MERATRHFTREFKQQAVRQVLVAGRSATDVARELGIRADQVRRWKRVISAGAAPSQRREELRRMRREIARLRAELAILERAAAVLGEDGLTVS